MIFRNCILTMGDVRKILHGGSLSVVPPQSYNTVWRAFRSKDLESLQDGWVGTWPFRSYHIGDFFAPDNNARRPAEYGSGSDIWLKVTPNLLVFLQKVPTHKRAARSSNSL